MRALDQEEYDHLRGTMRGVTIAADDPDRERHMAIDERLRLRGCAVRHDYPDGSFGYSKTPLGRLALRVSRPEMAFTI